MMYKGLAFLLCLAVVALANAKDTYTDKYDNVNLQEIMENEKLLLAYVNCLLDKGKCTPDAKELKDHIVEALETGCEKCTEKQEKGASDMITHLIEHKLDIWNELCAKYDSEGKYRKKYEDEARARGINIPQ